MAISFIGSASGSSSPNATTSVDLSGVGLQAGDLIIAALAVGDNDNNDSDIAAPTLTGVTFTEVADLSHTTDGQDIDLGVFYGYYTGSATSLAWAAYGGTDASNASVVMVFRGVRDAGSGGPFDVTSTTATGQDSRHPNPPSIDHTNASGLWIVIAGASAHLNGALGTFTFPTGYTTNKIDKSHDDTTDVSVGMGYRSSGFSDPEDPGVMTHSGGSQSTDSWAAVTMALREAGAGAQEVSPAALSMTLTPVAPTAIRVPQSVSPAALSMILTPVAPSIRLRVSAPAPIAMTLTPVAPTVKQQVNIGALSMTLTPVAPEVQQAGGAQSVSPAAQAMTITPVAPSVKQQVSPAVQSMTLTPVAPMILPDQIVSVGALSMTLAPLAPVINQAGGVQSVSPDALAMTIAAVAPTIKQQVSVGIQSMALTPVAPEIQQAGVAQQVGVEALAMTMAAVAPSISVEVPFQFSEPSVIARGDMFPSIGRNKRRPFRNYRRHR